MYHAVNYSGGSFEPAYGIYDDSRNNHNLHAYDTAELRNDVLARLRDGSYAWDISARAAARERDYALFSLDNQSNWQGQWSPVDEPVEPADTYARIEQGASVLSPSTQELAQRVDEQARELELLRERLATASAPITDTSDERLAPIWERAAEVAEENGFCSEYELLTNGLGIPGRPRTYRGIVRVQFNVYAYADGTSAYEAGEAMEQRLREAVAELRTDTRVDGSISHVDIDNTTVDDVEVYNR